MTTPAFEAAAREWTQLLRASEALALALKHAEALLKLAVSVALAQEPDAETTACIDDASPQNAQLLTSIALAVARLLRLTVRERMRSQLENDAQLLALLPPDFHAAFQQTLRDNWDALDAAARGSKLSLPRLEELQWCVAPPGVVLRLRTTGGASRTVRVPMCQFHQLRYSAAKVLQEMRQVEAHPIMRLTRSSDEPSNSSAAVSAAAP